MSLDFELRQFERRLRESGRDPLVELAEAERVEIVALKGRVALLERQLADAEIPQGMFEHLSTFVRVPTRLPWTRLRAFGAFLPSFFLQGAARGACCVPCPCSRRPEIRGVRIGPPPYREVVREVRLDPLDLGREVWLVGQCQSCTRVLWEIAPRA